MLRFAFLTSFLLGVFALSAQEPIDSFLVKPYLQWGTQTSMTVLWETSSTATTVVEYGAAEVQASEPNLSQRQTLSGTRQLHEVTLPGLKPATKYLYRVRSTFANGQELVSPVSTFRTTVRDEDACFFVFIGDSQYNSRTPWAWGEIAERIWEERPHFIIHAGDLVDQGTKKSDWTDHFFPNGQIAMSRFPMYTVLGNHEQDAQLYYDYMVQPQPEYYYTFRYGPVQFFMIDTNRDVGEGSEQYEWLEWELAKSQAPWKIVVHHHPPYSSEADDHGDTFIGASSYQTHARDLTPLYDAYGVDFCLFGHTHVYERTWPLLNNRISMENGVVYINSGGAGGGLEDFDPTRSWFTRELEQGHHYTTFAVFEQTLSFKALDHEGRLFDSFQLTKEVAGQGTGLQQPPPPRFRYERLVFQDSVRVVLEAFSPELAIHYTLDGSEPDRQSPQYQGPLVLKETATLKTRTYTADAKTGRVAERSFRQMEPLPAVRVARTEPGLASRYYEGAWKKLPAFDRLSPKTAGTLTTVTEAVPNRRTDQYGLVLEGYVDIPATGAYTFYVRSDDGSRLLLHETPVIDNDGSHSPRTKEATLILEKGLHPMRIEYFEDYGGELLRAGWVDPVLGRVPFHPGQLRHR